MKVLGVNFFLKHSVYLFRFRKNTQRIQQAITATNRLHVYILCKIWTGTCSM